MKTDRRVNVKSKIRLEVKRSAELWLFSFADMYMIISVLFIATTALYAKKAQEALKKIEEKPIQQVIVQTTGAPSAGRGPEAAAVQVAIEFEHGSTDLTVDALDNLRTILPLLSDLKNGYVEIEGYADGRGPASENESESTSNLELSSQRAVHVAEWFLKRGVPESRLRTTAFGAAHKFAGRGPNGVRTDRRVVVKFFATGAG